MFRAQDLYILIYQEALPPRSRSLVGAKPRLGRLGMPYTERQPPPLISYIQNCYPTLTQIATHLNTMNFAPYQDTAPDASRGLSPPPRRSSSRSPAPKSPPPNRPNADPFSSAVLPPPSHFSDEPRGAVNGDLESGRANVNLFETSLPIRLDFEAMMAYLLLPPAGGVFLLVMEHKSDYVRYAIPRGVKSIDWHEDWPSTELGADFDLTGFTLGSQACCSRQSLSVSPFRRPFECLNLSGASSHPFLVECTIMDAVRGRYLPHRLLELPCVS